MKRILSISLIAFLLLIPALSCKKKAVTPKAGEAKPEDMLSLIPQESKGVFFFNFQKLMNTDLVNKALQEKKSLEKYQEFVKKTGSDPKKDVFFIAAGLSEGMDQAKAKGAAVVNLKYNKDMLLSVIREESGKEGEIAQEEYNGVTLYSPPQEDKEEGSFVFLDESNIAVGHKDSVKAIIDVFQKRKENVFKNAALSELIAKTNKEAMFWGCILIPSNTMEQMTSQNPMLSNLNSISAATLFFDYKNKTYIAEIKAISADEAKNKQVADFLKGLKAFGGMAAAEKPEVGELMEKIEIVSEADHVRISASIPEALIEKLKEKKVKAEEEE